MDRTAATYGLGFVHRPMSGGLQVLIVLDRCCNIAHSGRPAAE